jgi:hypothetical protein
MPIVKIIPDGRGGKIEYSSRRTSFSFEFEFTYQPEVCYMIIFPPSPQQWTSATKLALSKRNATIGYIVKQITQHAGPDYTYVEYRDFVEIVKK